jgi:tripartite-type tricarboxylate transporter receptor subunit TctC
MRASLGALAATGLAPGHAAALPERPIRRCVGCVPGGGTDAGVDGVWQAMALAEFAAVMAADRAPADAADPRIRLHPGRLRHPGP